MGKHFDELSKALAKGASRRSALKRFAVGLAGAVLASVLPGRSAEAQIGEEKVCHDVCREAGFEGRDYSQCVAQCAACRLRGGNFVILNRNPLCA